MSESIDAAVARIRERSDLVPRVGFVLGSGLGGLADEVQEAVELPYAEIPGWPVSTAMGHAGVLVLGVLGGVPVAVMRGRAHLYEGIGAERVWRLFEALTFDVRRSADDVLETHRGLQISRHRIE